MAVYKLIKLKRDTSASWALINPILSLGEPGYETDSGKLKIGDGVSDWNSLDYIKVDMDDIVIDPDDLANVLNDVLVGGFGIDLIYSDPSDTILIRTTGLATQSDLIALSGEVANLDSALIFKGVTDPTQPDSAPTNPAPENGDMWISNADGKIDGSWVNLSGQDIVVDQFMLYEEDVNGWVLGGSTVGVDLSNYATKGELANLESKVNSNTNNIAINYIDIQQNIVDIQNIKSVNNTQQNQINALIQATGHIHDQDIYDIFNDLTILQSNYTALSGYSDARDDSLQQQINAISGAVPPEVDLSVISGYVAANTASGVVVLGKADQNSSDIITLSGLIDGGLDFKGYVDPTATGLAPSSPINGDLWVSDSSGVIDNGWTCLGGQDVGVNQWMIYSDDDNCWQLGPATDIDLSAYALKTELDAVSGLVNQNATDIITISGLVGSGIPSGLVEYSTGLAIRHGSTEVSVNEVSGNSVIDLTNWKIKDGHFIPNSNAAFDLGNAEYKVRHLFLSDNSIYMGSGKLSSQGDNNPILLWEGEPLAKITDINTIVSGELAEQKLLDLQDVTSDGPVEQYAVPVYDQGTTSYKVKRLSPLEVEDTSTPPLGGYPAGSLGLELSDIKGDIQSNTILISGIAEDIVEIPDAVIFKGVTDPTVSGSAPAGPDNGDMWVSNNSGLIDGSWTGLSGEDVVQNQFLLYSTGLSVWLKGGKIDVNDLSDQYLPLTGNLNPNDQKLDAVEFTSNTVTTSISGLYPAEDGGAIGTLTYVDHPHYPAPDDGVKVHAFGPSEFNDDLWKRNVSFGYDCVTVGYYNQNVDYGGYTWQVKVGPPTRAYPSGINYQGNPYPAFRARNPNPVASRPAFEAAVAPRRGEGAFSFAPFYDTYRIDGSDDDISAPYQVGFKSAPQNYLSFYKLYEKDPFVTPQYIGFHSDPYQQVFGTGGPPSKGWASHVDFQAGNEFAGMMGDVNNGRVYGFYANFLNRGGANCAGFIERGAGFNQLQAPTVFGQDTVYAEIDPFDPSNIYKPTAQIDLVQGDIRIRNAKLVQESTSGNPGEISWDQNGLLCYTSSSWKRAPLLHFTTTVTNPTSDSVALTVDGTAKLTATDGEASLELGNQAIFSVGNNSKTYIQKSRITLTPEYLDGTGNSVISIWNEPATEQAVGMTYYGSGILTNNTAMNIGPQAGLIHASLAPLGLLGTPAVVIGTSDGETHSERVRIDDRVLFKKDSVNKLEVCGTSNAMRLLDPGTEANPCLAFNYSDIGFYFAPDASGDFTTADAGIAFSISHPNAGQVARERLRFTRNGDIRAADDYTPTTDQSLVTKASILDTDITAPTTPNVTLRYDAPSTKWVDSGAGSVIVGSRPLTGWEAGTVGEALENGLAGATLPISSADDTVTLDGSSNTFSLSTSGVERLRAGLAADDSAYLMIGDTPQPSIPGISISSKGTGNGSQMQVRFVDSAGNYSYVGATQPSFNAGSANALVDGGVFFAGSEVGNSLFYARGGDLIFATAGLSLSSERLRISDTFAEFSVPVISGQTGGKMVIPAGNSVPANLLVGGTGEMPKDSFTICAKAGGTSVTNPQSVVWASNMNGDQYSGSAYFKLAHGDDGNNSQKSYWNIFASTPTDITDASGVYERTDYRLRIAGTVQKSTDIGAADPTVNYMSFIESTDNNYSVIRMERPVEFVQGVSGIKISNLDDVNFPPDAGGPIPNDSYDNYVLLFNADGPVSNGKWEADAVAYAQYAPASLPIGGYPAGSLGEKIESLSGGGEGSFLPIANSGTPERYRVNFVDTVGESNEITSPSIIRLEANGNLVAPPSSGSLRVGSLILDGYGRTRVGVGNSSTQSTNRNHHLYVGSFTDTGSTRVGIASRGTHFGDSASLNASGYQAASYQYTFYASMNYRNMSMLDSSDYYAIGPSNGGGANNAFANTVTAFRTPADFGNYIDHPTSGELVRKYGYRSDMPLALDADGITHRNFAILVNGSAPSRFNSDVQISETKRLRSNSSTSNELYFTGNATLHEGGRIIMRPRPGSIDPNVPTDGQYYLQFDQSRDFGAYAYRIYQFPSGQGTPLAGISSTSHGGGATVMYTNNTILGILGGSGIHFNGDGNSSYGYGYQYAMLAIKPDGDLQVPSFYTPLTDNSLVDKKALEGNSVSTSGYWFENRGQAEILAGAGTGNNVVIPVNTNAVFSSNDYMLNDGFVYNLRLGTASTSSSAAGEWIVKKNGSAADDWVVVPLSTYGATSNVPQLMIRPTTQIDPDTSQPYPNRHEVILYNNHDITNYTHSWNVQAYVTSSKDTRYSTNIAMATSGNAVRPAEDFTQYLQAPSFTSTAGNPRGDQAELTWNTADGGMELRTWKVDQNAVIRARNAGLSSNSPIMRFGNQRNGLGTFGGGYLYMSQNCEYDVATNDAWSFDRSISPSVAGSCVFSPMRGFNEGTVGGGMFTYPNVAGMAEAGGAFNNESVNIKDFAKALTWGANGQVAAGSTVTTNAQLYVNGPFQNNVLSITRDSTSRSAVHVLPPASQQSNAGGIIWQDRDRELYECVDVGGSGNQADFEWQVVDRDAKVAGTGEFVYKGTGPVNAFFAQLRFASDFDEGVSAWQKGLYVVNPAVAPGGNADWRLGKYAGVMVENCTVAKQASAFVSYQNTDGLPGNNFYTLNCAGTAPSHHRGNFGIGVGSTNPQVALDINSDRIALRNSYIPGSVSAGTVGEIAWSDDYIWVRTTAGWKKSPLYAFDQTPSLTVRVTQAEYDGLTPDPDITYVIVG